MKNKLKKKNKTKFDYTLRKLGCFSFVLLFISFSVIIPLSNSLKNENSKINRNIELMVKEETINRQFLKEYYSFVEK